MKTIAAALTGAAVLTLGCGKEESDQDKARAMANAKPTIRATPATLAADYEANEIAARRKYGATWVIVTGTIDRISDQEAFPVLRIRGDGSAVATCAWGGKAKELVPYRKGQTVSVRGLGAGMDHRMGFMLAECTIAPTEPEGSAAPRDVASILKEMNSTFAVDGKEPQEYFRRKGPDEVAVSFMGVCDRNAVELTMQAKPLKRAANELNALGIKRIVCVHDGSALTLPLLE